MLAMFTILLLVNKIVTNNAAHTSTNLPYEKKFVLIPTRDYLVMTHTAAHTGEKSYDDFVRTRNVVRRVASDDTEMCPLSRHAFCPRPEFARLVDRGIKRFLKIERKMKSRIPKIHLKGKTGDVNSAKTAAKRFDEVVDTMKTSFVDAIAEKIQDGDEDITMITLRLFGSLLQDACFKACKKSNRDDCSNKCYLDYTIRGKNVPIIEPIVELQREYDEKFKVYDEKLDNVKQNYFYKSGVWLLWVIQKPIEFLLKVLWYLVKFLLSAIKHCVLWLINREVIREMIPNMKDFLMCNINKMVYAAKEILSEIFKVYIPSVWADIVDFFQQL